MKKILGVLIVLLFVGGFIYRPFIYSNHIFDFYIADTLRCLFEPFISVFLILVFLKYTKKRILIYSWLFFASWECLNWALGGAFDIKI